MSDTPRTDAILAKIPGGQTCDPQLVADELRLPIAELERELEQERQDRVQAEKDVCRALGERNDARAEVALWKKRIVPFLAVHAGNYGKDLYGENCLHFTHYDMLAEAGGRMDDFKRCGDPEQP